MNKFKIAKYLMNEMVRIIPIVTEELDGSLEDMLEELKAIKTMTMDELENNYLLYRLELWELSLPRDHRGYVDTGRILDPCSQDYDGEYAYERQQELFNDFDA